LIWLALFMYIGIKAQKSHSLSSKLRGSKILTGKEIATIFFPSMSCYPAAVSFF
jgi:hypothetical protein